MKNSFYFIFFPIIYVGISGCSLNYLDAPMPNTSEIWTKVGYSSEQTKYEANLCGNLDSKVSYKEFYCCMVNKGFQYNIVRGRGLHKNERPSCSNIE
ncbi:MAG: hypothetical protein PHO65_00845 [Sulfurovum sp.]|nr:hypothetical protein [Sulfurovum sp.]